MKVRNLIYLATAIICCAASTTTRAQTVNLQLQGDYVTGAGTNTPILAVGDLNNDRKPDLVALNKNNPSANGPIAVFLNNGNGGFASAINITDNTGLSPNSVALGDYNHDGFLDMAIANDGTSTAINIRLGNGTGNFASGTYIPLAGGAFKMLTADLNGDGNLDLVTEINQVSATDLKVLFGNGAGGFSAPTSYAVASHADFEIGDFNMDGSPDITVVGSGVIRTYLNNGAGVFTAVADNTSVSVNRAVTADFNRDCIPDLAVVGNSGAVRILLGNGAGSFTAQPVINITNEPSDIVVGDFNRDKKVDIAIRRTSSTVGVPNFTILPGDGSGGFGTAFELSLALAGQATYSQRLATLDANLDGKRDIIIARQGGFMLYDGNSALFTRTDSDFDGDLSSDRSVYRPSEGNWYIDRSTNGAFAAHWGISTDKPVPGDFDGDGKADIAVWRANGFGDPNASYFFILRSSDGTLQQDQFGRSTDNSSLVGDWDGDGKADVAVYRGGAAVGDQSYFFYRPSASPGTNFRAIPYGLNGDQAIRGDFDGDGKLDATVFRPSNGVWYIAQSSNAQTVTGVWGLASDHPIAADYDGDGRTDLAVFRPSNSTWYILGSAGTPIYRQWGAAGDVVVPADFNGDGKTETSVYRPSDQRWYTPPCAGFTQNGIKFGLSGDTAVPGSLFQ